MTVWMLVSKQNIFTDDNLLTHSVLLQYLAYGRERSPVLKISNKKLLITTVLT